jgi:hypothetical protein
MMLFTMLVELVTDAHRAPCLVQLFLGCTSPDASEISSVRKKDTNSLTRFDPSMCHNVGLQYSLQVDAFAWGKWNLP